MASKQQQQLITLLDNRGNPRGNGSVRIEWPMGSFCTMPVLQAQVQRATGIAPHRQRLALRDDKGKFHLLDPASTDLRSAFASIDGASWGLQVKDLGPQISWRTVFLVEYAGPFLIHLWFILKEWPLRHSVQILAAMLFLGHFAKREWETLRVHRFSHATMPLMNLFKNCGHYWILSGVLLARELYSQEFRASANGGWVWMAGWSVGMLAAEMANYRTHCILRDLRPSAASTRRAIPRGFGFDWGITCPNYTFEIAAWFCFAMMLRGTSVWAWVFLAVSSGQMYLWARKKHIRYVREFGLEFTRLQRRPLVPHLF